jgi:hypothetical protein
MVNFGRATRGQERMLETKEQVIADIFRILEFWLRHGNQYLVSDKKPTIVDLSCYNEVIQLEVMGLLENLDEKFPKSAAWLKRMKVRLLSDTYLAVIVLLCSLMLKLESLAGSAAPRRDARPHDQVLQEVQARVLQALSFLSFLMELDPSRIQGVLHRCTLCVLLLENVKIIVKQGMSSANTDLRLRLDTLKSRADYFA